MEVFIHRIKVKSPKKKATFHSKKTSGPTPCWETRYNKATRFLSIGIKGFCFPFSLSTISMYLHVTGTLGSSLAPRHLLLHIKTKHKHPATLPRDVARNLDCWTMFPHLWDFLVSESLPAHGWAASNIDIDIIRELKQCKSQVGQDWVRATKEWGFH